jgi:hypothetical protein
VFFFYTKATLQQKPFFSPLCIYIDDVYLFLPPQKIRTLSNVFVTSVKDLCERQQNFEFHPFKLSHFLRAKKEQVQKKKTISLHQQISKEEKRV